MKDKAMKLHLMSRVSGKGDDYESDSVKRSVLECGNDRTRGMFLLQEASQYYNSMYQFRLERERNKRYTYGDQWGDIICVDGVKMTEDEYIRSQGNIPLKTNLIRRLVNTVIGVYRGSATEPTCVARDRDEQQQAETMSTVLQYNMQLNRMTNINARSMEEYLISGFVVHRKWYGWRNDKMDCWTDNVQPNNFFIDVNMKDFRGWDCSFVGEVHDVSFEQICEQFAKRPEDYAKLSEIYKFARDHNYTTTLYDQFGFNRQDWYPDLLTPLDPTRCRVIEIWRKETKARYRCHDYNNGEVFKVDEKDYNAIVLKENLRRREMAKNNGIPEEEIPYIKAEWFIDSYWYYYYLSPLGDILAEGETPYEHKSHPYVFKAYPFIDGEIHSFVSDVIDVQRYANHIIIMDDWIRRAGAKGLLMIPEDTIPEGSTPDEFADTWARFNGVIVYKPSKSGQVPHQVSNNSSNVGSNEMLSMQLRFFEEISGVNGALQGKAGFSGMSAALYSQQTQNATTSLLDILDSFNEFLLDAAYKDVKNIQQFYDQKKCINIAGKTGTEIVYDPEKIRDVEFDLNIVPSQTTPVYRAISNEFLMQLFSQQAISLEQLLENGNFPFSDRLLQSIQAQKEQMQNGQVPDGVSPELMKEVEQNANMQAVAQMEGAMRGESN